MTFIKSKQHNYDTNNGALKVIYWPDYVLNLNEKKFIKFIKKYPLSVVDFWATWCTPCNAMAPRMRRLAKIYKGKVAFGKLDIQKNQVIAKRYKIMGIPQLIFFRYGKKITSVTGEKQVGDIKKMIDNLLEKNI
jgi:thioredoxin